MSLITNGGRYADRRAPFWNSPFTPSKPKTEYVPAISLFWKNEADESYHVKCSTSWSARFREIWRRNGGIGALEGVPNPSERREIAPIPSTTITKAQKNLLPSVVGWRKGLSITLLAFLLALFINVAILIGAIVNFDREDDIITLKESDSATIHKLSFWIHMLINFLGTVLLAGSNYCMQRLTAPSRTEIDNCHKRLRWLDIGALSLRNLGSISHKKKVIWVFLALSSAPLHLMYNSVVFKTESASPYLAAAVPPRFLRPDFFNYMPTIQPAEVYDILSLWTAVVPTKIYLNGSIFQNITVKECISRYNRPFVSRYGTLIAVQANDTYGDLHTIEWGRILISDGPNGHPGSTFYYNGSSNYDITDTQYLGKKFICSKNTDTCDLNSMAAGKKEWQVGDQPIAYCLSQVAEEHSQLQFSVKIMIVAICCNFVKTLCLLITLFTLKEQPLITIGDAVASFLACPDPVTAHCGLISHEDARRYPIKGEAIWLGSTYKWAGNASIRRWFVCVAVFVVVFVVSLSFLGGSINTIKSFGDGTNPWSFDIGQVSTAPIRFNSLSKSVVAAVLVANLPQVVVSCMYTLYNNLLTCMLVGLEWSKFSQKRVHLRVSYPSGHQRSTTWLQLPYRYAIPLATATFCLHWFTSQSIFLTRIAYYDQIYDPSGNHTQAKVGEVSGCGYSPTGIVGAMSTACIILLTVAFLGHRRYNKGIPLCSTNSLAISAACHRPELDSEAATSALMWGEVQELQKGAQGSTESSGFTKGSGHCCLTSWPVEPPVKGRYYT